MKKLFFTISAFAVAFSCHAGTVSRSRAADVAASVFGTSPSSLSPQRAPRASVVVPGNADELYYIFNNPEGGFAIISALDCTMPVLGYSSDGHMDTDDLPPAARDWFSAMESELRNIRDAAVEPSVETLVQWSAPAVPGKNPVMRTTPEWNQGSPFNAFCPKVNGTACMTGCCATAASEVLRYHCWPETRTVTIPAYTSDWHGVKIQMPAREPVSYDWDNMPMSGGNDAVALLMADVGAAVGSDYGTSSTAAVSNDMVDALTTYFGYDKGASFRSMDMYAPSDWAAAIRQQIDECGPLYFRATAANPDAAHAFVLDGRADDNYFHFNFGWSGSYNGWFLLTALGPASGYTFTAAQSAIFDLVPDRTGTSVSMPLLWYYSAYGLKSYSDIFSGSFNISLGSLTNKGPSVFNGKFRIVLKDAYDNLKVSQVNINELAGKILVGSTFSPGAVPCRLDSAPVMGDKFVLQYSVDGRTWKDVSYSPSITTGEYLAFPMYVIADVGKRILINGDRPYETAEWTVVSGTRCRVVITYADGTVETIVQE